MNSAQLDLIKAARDMLSQVRRMLDEGEWYDPEAKADRLWDAIEALERADSKHRGDARRHFICICPDCLAKGKDQRRLDDLADFLEAWVGKHGKPDSR
jgi:hypothetical protein